MLLGAFGDPLGAFREVLGALGGIWSVVSSFFDGLVNSQVHFPTLSSPRKTSLPGQNTKTKHCPNRLPGRISARLLHDLIHSTLCMDMHRSTLVYIYMSKFAQGLAGSHTTFFLIPEVCGQAKTVLFAAPEPLGPRNGHSDLPGPCWSVRQGRLGLFRGCPGARNVGP